MTKFILAEKRNMTQKYGSDGAVIPVTKVSAGPCVVTQVKGKDKNGYTAIQIGFSTRRKLSKPLKGHLKDLGNFRYLKEFRVGEDQTQQLKVGDTITVNAFAPGDVVAVTGISKGKGFQGVVKRWGFHGSPKSHGHKDQLRMPGSIGATGPAHVFKGTKMGGQMGNAQVTVKNLEVIEVDPADNALYIKGAIPGATGNMVMIAADGELVINQGDVTLDKQASEQADKPVSSQASKSETQEAKPAEVTEVEEVKDESKPEAQPDEQIDKQAEKPVSETKTEDKQASEQADKPVSEAKAKVEDKPEEKSAKGGSASGGK